LKRRQGAKASTLRELVGTEKKSGRSRRERGGYREIEILGDRKNNTMVRWPQGGLS